MKRWFVIPSLLVVAALTFGTAAIAQDAAKAVKEREALMKSNGKDAKALSAAVKKGKVGAKEAAIAAQLVANAKKIPTLFPEGSGSDKFKKSRAKPEIWASWSKFEADSAALGKAAEAYRIGGQGGRCRRGRQGGQDGGRRLRRLPQGVPRPQAEVRRTGN